MQIQDLEDGEFLNNAREKINDAFGEIPVLYNIDAAGNLLVTKHSGETLIVPFKNYFALLTTVFNSVSVGLATPLVAGKVLLVDDDIPDQAESSGRVLSAAQVIARIDEATATLPPNINNPAEDQTLVLHYNTLKAKYELVNKGILTLLTALGNTDKNTVLNNLFTAATNDLLGSWFTLLARQANDTAIGILCQKLTLLGCGGGTSPGTTALLKVKEIRCFQEPILTILKEAIQNYHLANQAISFDKTNFLTPGIQLFDKNSIHNTPQKYITDEGIEVGDANLIISHPVPVKELTPYTPNVDGQYVAFFNKAGQSTGGAALVRDRATFVTTAGTDHIKVSIPLSEVYRFMLVEGEVLPDLYTPFVLDFQGESQQGRDALAQGYRLDSLAPRLTTGQQLFNYLDLGNQPNSLIDEGSTITDYAGYTVSHFIPVTPNTVYVTTDSQYVGFFSVNRKPRRGVRYDRGPSSAFTTGPDTYFVRLAIPNSLLATYGLVKGSVLPANLLPYKLSLNVTTPQGDAAQQSANAALSASNALSQLIVVSQQLFNNDPLVTTPNTFEYVNGTPEANGGYTLSGLIPAKPLTWYSPTFRAFASYYDANQQKLGVGANYDRVDGMGNPQLPFKTTAETAFFKCSVPTSLLATFMVVEGLVLPTIYQAFGGTTSKYLRVDTNQIGKKALVTGTSIATLIQGGQYEAACKNLGIYVMNFSEGGSCVRISRKDGTFDGNSYISKALCMAATSAEKEEFIANYESFYKPKFNPAFGVPDTLSDTEKAKIRSSSYETKIIPYYDSANPLFGPPDLLIFDHGFNDNTFPNDTDLDWEQAPADPFDRRCFIGAMNYVIREIQKKYPRAKMAFVSHYEHELYPRVVKAQQFLATRYNFPILRLDQVMGYSQQKVPNTQQYWVQSDWSPYTAGKDTSVDMSALQFALPDNLHFGSDSTGFAVRKATGFLEPFLKTTVF